MIGGGGIGVCVVSAEDSTATRQRLMSDVEAPTPLAKGKRGSRSPPMMDGHICWSVARSCDHILRPKVR
jgi:hypothetical protein